MRHGIELAALLLLLTTGHGVLDVAPHAVRRIVRGYAGWILAFAIGVLVFAWPRIAESVVRLGIVLVGVYGVRLIIGSVVDHFAGPYFFAAPGRAMLASAVNELTGLPVPTCRAMARRVLRGHDGYLALLGLVSLGSEAEAGADGFAVRWEEACDEARAEALRLVERFGPRGEGCRPTTSDARFIAQALSLYEVKSVERILNRIPAPAFGGRGRRMRAAALLEEAARPSDQAIRLGLVAPSDAKRTRPKAGPRVVTLLNLLWPALGLRAAGFRNRALAFGLSHALLLAYGSLALYTQRNAGWMFLAVAVLIHIEGAFALGDFAAVAAMDEDATMAERETA